MTGARFHCRSSRFVLRIAAKALRSIRNWRIDALPCATPALTIHGESISVIRRRSERRDANVRSFLHSPFCLSWPSWHWGESVPQVARSPPTSGATNRKFAGHCSVRCGQRWSTFSQTPKLGRFGPDAKVRTGKCRADIANPQAAHFAGSPGGAECEFLWRNAGILEWVTASRTGARSLFAGPLSTPPCL